MVSLTAPLSVLTLAQQPVALTERLPMTVLSIDHLGPAYSPRVSGVDPTHVKVLEQAISPLPPILVQDGSLRVIDGMHRVCAARLRGEQTIEARLFRGSDEDAFLLAVEANVTHGLPLSLTDRIAAGKRIVRSHPERSDRAIAELTGLAHKTVAALRARPTGGTSQLDERRVGRDGRVRPVNAAAGRRRAAAVIAARPGASLRQIAAAAAVSAETARDVRARLERGEDPAPPRGHAWAQPGQAVAPGISDLDRRRRAANRDRSPVDILHKLARDPALRTDSGRQLLRWLYQCITQQHCPLPSLDVIPDHCALAVAALARKVARSWTDLARQLEQRAQS